MIGRKKPKDSTANRVKDLNRHATEKEIVKVKTAYSQGKMSYLPPCEKNTNENAPKRPCSTTIGKSPPEANRMSVVRLWGSGHPSPGGPGEAQVPAGGDVPPPSSHFGDDCSPQPGAQCNTRPGPGCPLQAVCNSKSLQTTEKPVILGPGYVKNGPSITRRQWRKDEEALSVQK